MKASVIIPTRNRAGPLDRTLNALAGQAEIVVVDDASTDNTRQVASHYKTRYEYVKRSDNRIRKVSEIRNIGAELANGDILIFLDSDMVVKPGFVREHLKSHKSADVILGTRNDGGPDPREPLFLICGDDPMNLPLPWAILYSHNFSVKREHFFRVGGFSTYFDSWGGEDQDLGYKLHRIGLKFALNRRLSALHQAHDTEYTSEFQKKANLIINCTKFFEKYNDKSIKEYFGLDKKALRVGITGKCNNNCSFCVGRGEDLTHAQIADALRSVPLDWKIVLEAEPTIRDDFFDVLKLFSGRKVELETNARAFSYMDFSSRAMRYLNDFRIHLFSNEKILHDEITKTQSFEQSQKGIKNLQSQGAGIAGNIVLSKKNHLFFDDIIRFYEKKGISSFSVSMDGDKDIFEKMKQIRGVVFNDVFYRCYQETLTGNCALNVQRMRSCTRCAFLRCCRGRPGDFFA